MWPFTKKKAPVVQERSPMPDVEKYVETLHYSTKKATLLARRRGEGVCFADYGEERLYQTASGRYFTVHYQEFAQRAFTTTTLYWTLWPRTRTEAIACYHHLPEQSVSFREAFGEEISEA